MGMIYTGHNLIENFRQYRMYQTITISKYDQHGKPVFLKIVIKEDKFPNNRYPRNLTTLGY